MIQHNLLYWLLSMQLTRLGCSSSSSLPWHIQLMLGREGSASGLGQRCSMWEAEAHPLDLGRALLELHAVPKFSRPSHKDCCVGALLLACSSATVQAKRQDYPTVICREVMSNMQRHIEASDQPTNSLYTYLALSTTGRKQCLRQEQKLPGSRP